MAMLRTLMAYLRRFWPVHLLTVLVLAGTAMPLWQASGAIGNLRPVQAQPPTADWAPGVVGLVGEDGPAPAFQSVDGTSSSPWQSLRNPRGPRRTPTQLWHDLTPVLPEGAQGTAIRGVYGAKDFGIQHQGVVLGAVALSPAEVDFTDPHLDRLLVLTAGRLPSRPGEVVVSQATAATYGLVVGASIKPPALKPGARLIQDQPALNVTGIVRQRFGVTVQGIPPRDWMFGQTGTLIAQQGAGADEARTSWAIAASAPITWPDVVAANQRGFLVQSKAVVEHPPACSELSSDYQRPRIQDEELDQVLDPCAAQTRAEGFRTGLRQARTLPLGVFVAMLLLAGPLLGGAGRRRAPWLATHTSGRPRLLLLVSALVMAAASLVVSGTTLWVLNATNGSPAELNTDPIWRLILPIAVHLILALITTQLADAVSRPRWSSPLLRWGFALAGFGLLVNVWQLQARGISQWGSYTPVKASLWCGLALACFLIAASVRRYPDPSAWRRAWLPLLNSAGLAVAGAGLLVWVVLRALVPSLFPEAYEGVLDVDTGLVLSVGLMAWGAGLAGFQWAELRTWLRPVLST